MARKKYWIGSTGPYYYDDTKNVNDPEGIVLEKQSGIVADRVKVLNAPSVDNDALRKGDLAAGNIPHAETHEEGGGDPIEAAKLLGYGTFGEAPNYAEFESDGILRFYGTSTTFNDKLQSLLKEAKNNPGARIVDNYAEGTLDFNDNALLDDYAVMNIQMGHDWKIGSVVYPHIHWFQNSSAVPNWLVQYRWQVNGGVKDTTWTNYPLLDVAFTYSSGIIIQISTDDNGLTPPVGAGLSDILQIRIIRDTNNDSGLFAGTDSYTGTAATLNLDLHYEINSIGSDEQYAK